MHLIIDCDDVLRDFVSGVIKTYNEQNKTNKTLEDITDWEITKNLTQIENFYDFVMKNQTEILLFSEPLPNAKETMQKFKEDGHKITIATHQFYGTEGQTLGWLYKNNIPYDNLCFIKDKYLLRGDVMIDDKLSNLMKFAIHNRPSLSVVVDKPWNKEVKQPYISSDGIREYVNVFRVKGIMGARNLLNKYINGEKIYKDYNVWGDK